MKKRIASVLVALVMVLSLVPKTSWAWTSTVTTLEQLKSAMSELSYNNTIEIVVSGTIEISETLNIRPTRTTINLAPVFFMPQKPYKHWI